MYVPAPDTGPAATEKNRARQRFPLSRVALLFVLAILVYLPALSIPFIVDDYDQIPLARHFTAQGWTRFFITTSCWRVRPTCFSAQGWIARSDFRPSFFIWQAY